MRLQLVRPPDALHRAGRGADCLGHRPTGPVRHLMRWFAASERKSRLFPHPARYTLVLLVVMANCPATLSLWATRPAARDTDRNLSPTGRLPAGDGTLNQSSTCTNVMVAQLMLMLPSTLPLPLPL